MLKFHRLKFYSIPSWIITHLETKIEDGSLASQIEDGSLASIEMM